MSVTLYPNQPVFIVDRELEKIYESKIECNYFAQSFAYQVFEWEIRIPVTGERHPFGFNVATEDAHDEPDDEMPSMNTLYTRELPQFLTLSLSKWNELQSERWGGRFSIYFTKEEAEKFLSTDDFHFKTYHVRATVYFSFLSTIKAENKKEAIKIAEQDLVNGNFMGKDFFDSEYYDGHKLTIEDVED